MYRQAYHSAILRTVHTLYLYVLCGSENKQRLFRYTILTDWFLYPRRSLLRGTTRAISKSEYKNRIYHFEQYYITLCCLVTHYRFLCLTDHKQSD
jgi:hypothetical protein